MHDLAPLVCEECRCTSDGDATGWAGSLGCDPDANEPELVYLYCPTCAAIQFGYQPDRAAKYA